MIQRTVQHSTGSSIQHSTRSYIQNRQEKEIKDIQVGKEEVKLFLLADGMTLYMGCPKDSAKCLSEFTNELGKLAGYKANEQKSVAFLYTDSNLKRKLRKTSTYNSNKNNKILLN